MRACLPWLIAVACYSPDGTPGRPCDPARPDCPAGQVCTIGEGAAVCETPSAPASDGSVASDARPLRFEYVATIAECINPMSPSPAACRASHGVAQLAVELLDGETGAPWQGYIKFELDAAFAGRSIEEVTLRMVATNGSDSTGEIRRVSPFTVQSLGATPPAALASLASSRGPVEADDVVRWPLPNNTVAEGDVYIGVTSQSDNGVTYWNLDGADPPRLVIDAR